jgi:hypothetical protein
MSVVVRRICNVRRRVALRQPHAVPPGRTHQEIIADRLRLRAAATGNHTFHPSPYCIMAWQPAPPSHLPERTRRVPRLPRQMSAECETTCNLPSCHAALQPGGLTHVDRNDCRMGSSRQVAHESIKRRGSSCSVIFPSIFSSQLPSAPSSPFVSVFL